MERWQEFLAVAYYVTHKQACETWTHGDIAHVWYNTDNLCIRYADGQWWHYRQGAYGLEWW